MTIRALVAAWIVLAATPAGAAAQGLDGYASVMADVLPAVERRAGERQGMAELRSRLFVERRFDPLPVMRITLSGFAEGLLAERGQPGVSRTAIVRPHEVHAEFQWARADMRIGLSRVVWGRLDEFLPTDVVNPIDLARFFLEGRVEARLPVGMVRGRWLPSDRFTLEALYVPVFRRGVFDQLDEAASPFNVAPAVPRISRRPARTAGNGEGGVRISATTGRVDWSLSGYRGFERLPVYELERPALVERHPRFTMIGGDMETVRGPWGIRAEAAVFAERRLQVPDRPLTSDGDSIEAGVGVDRAAGPYRVSATVLVAKRTGRGAVAVDDTDTTLVGSIDRTFARETRRLRVFGVYNPADESAFARAIASFSLRDDVGLEASGGVFTGGAADAIGRFASRDFLYVRLKVFF